MVNHKRLFVPLFDHRKLTTIQLVPVALKKVRLDEMGRHKRFRWVGYMGRARVVTYLRGAWCSCIGHSAMRARVIRFHVYSTCSCDAHTTTVSHAACGLCVGFTSQSYDRGGDKQQYFSIFLDRIARCVSIRHPTVRHVSALPRRSHRIACNQRSCNRNTNGLYMHSTLRLLGEPCDCGARNRAISCMCGLLSGVTLLACFCLPSTG